MIFKKNDKVKYKDRDYEFISYANNDKTPVKKKTEQALIFDFKGTSGFKYVAIKDIYNIKVLK